MTNKKIRILLADDNESVRASLATLLKRNSDLDVVGEVSDGKMAVEQARELLPDVVIMDLKMPEMNGIDATRLIISEHADIKVIGFSAYSKSPLGDEMQSAGASFCISKADPIQDLLAAIHNCEA